MHVRFQHSCKKRAEMQKKAEKNFQIAKINMQKKTKNVKKSGKNFSNCKNKDAKKAENNFSKKDAKKAGGVYAKLFCHQTRHPKRFETNSLSGHCVCRSFRNSIRVFLLKDSIENCIYSLYNIDIRLINSTQ